MPASRAHPSTLPLRIPFPDRSRHLIFDSYLFFLFLLTPQTDNRFGKNKKPTADLATVGLEIWFVLLVLDESSHRCRARLRQMPTRHLIAGAGARSFNCDERYVHFFTPSVPKLSAAVNFY